MENPTTSTRGSKPSGQTLLVIEELLNKKEVYASNIEGIAASTASSILRRLLEQDYLGVKTVTEKGKSRKIYTIREEQALRKLKGQIEKSLQLEIGTQASWLYKFQRPLILVSILVITILVITISSVILLRNSTKKISSLETAIEIALNQISTDCLTVKLKSQAEADLIKVWPEKHRAKTCYIDVSNSDVNDLSFLKPYLNENGKLKKVNLKGTLVSKFDIDKLQNNEPDLLVLRDLDRLSIGVINTNQIAVVLAGELSSRAHFITEANEEQNFPRVGVEFSGELKTLIEELRVGELDLIMVNSKSIQDNFTEEFVKELHLLVIFRVSPSSENRVLLIATKELSVYEACLITKDFYKNLPSIRRTTIEDLDELSIEENLQGENLSRLPLYSKQENFHKEDENCLP